MQKDKNEENYQEVISMEEYLTKRQKLREKEQKKKKTRRQEKSSLWMLAELYV